MASSQTRWTATMVRALPDDGFRHEVVDGMHLVTPAPSWTHQDAVLQLARRLMDYVAQRAIGHVVIAPADVEFDEHNLVERDLFVVPLVGGKRPRAWEDRLRKRRLYQRQGVPEYWIVDVDARAVERWRATEDVGTVFTDALVWEPGRAVEPLAIDLGEYFRDVTGEG